MKDIVKKLSALIEVRKMVTLLFSLVFAYMAITSMIDEVNTLAILTMVFGYYFGKSTALDKSSDKNDTERM